MGLLVWRHWGLLLTSTLSPDLAPLVTVIWVVGIGALMFGIFWMGSKA